MKLLITELQTLHLFPLCKTYHNSYMVFCRRIHRRHEVWACSWDAPTDLLLTLMVSIFIQIFVCGSKTCKLCTAECVIILHGHPRSLILAPIERIFLLALSSNSCPILLRFRDIRAYLCRKPLFPCPTLFQPTFWGVPKWSRSVTLGSADGEYSRLTKCEIISVVLQPV